MRQFRFAFFITLLFIPTAVFGFSGNNIVDAVGSYIWNLTTELRIISKFIGALPAQNSVAQVGQSNYTLSVSKIGPGDGLIQGSGIDCGDVCTKDAAPGSLFVLQATPFGNSYFFGWGGNAGCTGIGTCIFNINAGRVVTAEFRTGEPITKSFTARVVKHGTGTGTIYSGQAIECGSDCTHTAPQGTSITMVAVADNGSRFSGWTGSGCAGTQSCVITLSKDTEVNAYFDTYQSPSSITPQNSGPLYTLRVLKSGGGDGIVQGSGIDCGSECTRSDVKWTTVTLQAFPQSNSFFDGWTGSPCSGHGSCEVLLNKDYTVTANFVPNTVRETPPSTIKNPPALQDRYAVVVSKSGTGTGTVTSDGINCGTDCNEPFLKNAKIVLTPTPDQDSIFRGWSGGVCTVLGPCSVTVNSNKLITARFEKKPVLPVGYYEAEGGVLSESMSILKDTNASGERYVSSGVRDFGRVTLTISAPTSGYYTLWARILSRDIQSDSFYVSLDGGAEDIYDTAENLWSPFWQWTRVTGRDQNNGRADSGNVNARLFMLSAGNHTLQFRTRDPNTKLDKIFITLTPTEVPTGFATPRSTPTTLSTDYFTRNLTVGSQGEDVQRLQRYLNDTGFIVARSGIGSPGNEGTYYGSATADAVARFQEYYATDTLSPRGLSSGTGIFEEFTRNKANKLIGPIRRTTTTPPPAVTPPPPKIIVPP